MNQIAANLDPTKFTVVPHTAVLDEFRMTNGDGSFVATIDEKFLDSLVARMRERESTTGDLCPAVIGHTKEGEAEIASPRIVGYCRNWHTDAFFDTGRKAAFVDLWIMNEEVELARKFPRRSAEVWADRFEIDPLSLLGATTPARDLGLMKLSRGGSFTYTSPGDTQMPEPKVEPKPEETGAAKGTEAKLDQLLALLTQLLDTSKAGAAGPTGKEGSPEDEMSDEEFMKLIGGGGDNTEPKEDESRKDSKPPVQNQGNPGGDNTHVAELGKMRAKLARNDVERFLEKARGQGKDVDPEDQELITDLVAMPEDLRARSLDRLVKNARALPSRSSHFLDTAVAGALEGPGGKRPATAEDTQKIIKLARAKGVTYEDAAEQLGFSYR